MLRTSFHSLFSMHIKFHVHETTVEAKWIFSLKHKTANYAVKSLCKITRQFTYIEKVVEVNTTTCMSVLWKMAVEMVTEMTFHISEISKNVILKMFKEIIKVEVLESAATMSSIVTKSSILAWNCNIMLLPHLLPKDILRPWRTHPNRNFFFSLDLTKFHKPPLALWNLFLRLGYGSCPDGAT